jgi:hypothetical protein
MSEASHKPFADDCWPDSRYEPSINPTTFFSEARVAVIDGVAHLVFCIEQPSTQGGTEFVVVARMMASFARAASVLSSIGCRLVHGTTLICPRASIAKRAKSDIDDSLPRSAPR